MAVWRFDENKCDFARVPVVVWKDDERDYLAQGAIYLVVEEDPGSLFGCLLYLDFGGGSTQRISHDESTFTVAGVEFRRSAYASPRYLVDPIEAGVQARIAELMAEVRGQGGAL
ncbi:MAG: hypothetical protein WC859_10300 [Elusimicrobiota bacterium]|jgi:hypothetical protein